MTQDNAALEAAIKAVYAADDRFKGRPGQWGKAIAEAAIAAYEAAKPQETPEVKGGEWRWMPVELTHEMLDAAFPGEAGKTVSAKRGEFIARWQKAVAAVPSKAPPDVEWRWVPVSPTKQMIKAGEQEMVVVNYGPGGAYKSAGSADDVFAAMVATAPAKALPDVEGLIKDGRDYAQEMHDGGFRMWALKVEDMADALTAERLRAEKAERERDEAVDAHTKAAASEDYLRLALAAAHQEARKEALAVVEPWLKADHVRLHAGEMTASEMRSVLAVVGAISRALAEPGSDRKEVG